VRGPKAGAHAAAHPDAERPGTGLVLCAISGRGDHTALDDPGSTFDASALDGLVKYGFPSAELVGTAAALLSPVIRTDVGRTGVIHEGPSYEIVVGPGLVQTTQRNYSRAERTHERQVDASRKTIDEQVSDTLHREAEGLDPVEPVTRGKITAWSAKSRSNMRRTIASLDFAPLFEHAPLAAMTTLTYPGACDHCREFGDPAGCRAWLDVAPTRAAVNAHVFALKRRYLRAWGHKITGLWKLEFQGRGAPHVHILMAPPRGRSPLTGELFREWLSRTWAQIVGHPDAGIRERHQAAGTGIDWAEGLRQHDPRRVATYFAKHGVLAGKEYQHEVPAEWQAAGGSGRWWGYWGLSKATVTVAVTPEAWVWTQRTMRRHSRANSYLRTERRPRVRGGVPEPVTHDVQGLAGVELLTRDRPVRYRSTTVRSYVGKGRHGSGYRVLNDGPGWLAQVAMWLPTVVGTNDEETDHDRPRTGRQDRPGGPRGRDDGGRGLRAQRPASQARSAHPSDGVVGS
jgi:hypothetical protein